jgi:hypothetical protein
MCLKPAFYLALTAPRLRSAAARVADEESFLLP